MNLGNLFHQFYYTKKDERFRGILILKKINECVEYLHFKIHDLQNILKIVELICLMLSLDIKDA